MNKRFIAALVALLASLSAHAFDSRTDMKPYPPPQPGYERMVFNVPAVENEMDHRVEIIAGKMMMVDCNLIRMGGRLEKRVAKGWGYPFYIVRSSGETMSTMMACPPGQEKKKEFVQVQGEDFVVRYNSKLPVVLYVPKGFEVRYRIWSAGKDIGKADIY